MERLTTDGQFFRQGGKRFTAIGASDFFLLGRYLNGEDIEPVLQQRASAGINMLRVWTRMQLAQYGIGDCTLAMHPDLYDRIPAFLRLAAQYGLYIEFTAYTGREDYDPQHWNRLIAAVRDETNVLLELVNENDQSGNRLPDIGMFQRPIGILASHGSNGSEQRPVEPFWDYATFHTNGAFEEVRKIGHNAWEVWHGPTYTNETSRYPDVGMWAGKTLAEATILAYDAAAGAALLCAGSAFHSRLGKRSVLWDQDTLAVAQAWAAGAQSVPFDCQSGPYRHPQEEEDPEQHLRIYRRGWWDQCRVVIRGKQVQTTPLPTTALLVPDDAVGTVDDAGPYIQGQFRRLGIERNITPTEFEFVRTWAIEHAGWDGNEQIISGRLVNRVLRELLEPYVALLRSSGQVG